MADVSANIFYVYRHSRNDTGSVFYIGKGKENRAYQADRGRNNHWRNIVRKANGFSVDFIINGISEELSHLVEIEAIDCYRRRGISLANITNGGEGVSGLRHSEETKAVIREKRKRQNVVFSQETREKIAAAQRGKSRGPNPEHSARLTGRKLSDEHKAKIGAAHTGMKRSEEARAAMSAAQRSAGIQSVRQHAQICLRRTKAKFIRKASKKRCEKVSACGGQR